VCRRAMGQFGPRLVASPTEACSWQAGMPCLQGGCGSGAASWAPRLQRAASSRLLRRAALPRRGCVVSLRNAARVCHATPSKRARASTQVSYAALASTSARQAATRVQAPRLWEGLAGARAAGLLHEAAAWLCSRCCHAIRLAMPERSAPAVQGASLLHGTRVLSCRGDC